MLLRDRLELPPDDVLVSYMVEELSPLLLEELDDDISAICQNGHQSFGQSWPQPWIRVSCRLTTLFLWRAASKRVTVWQVGWKCSSGALQNRRRFKQRSIWKNTKKTRLKLRMTHLTVSPTTTVYELMINHRSSKGSPKALIFLKAR